MEVFVTDGEQRSTLAVVRALGGVGIPVTVAGTEAVSLAGASRYCAARARYPSPRTDPEGFQAFLRAEMEKRQSVFLLPMSDITVRLTSRMRASLPPRVLIPFPCERQIECVQDKRRILLLARQVGIATPDTYMLQPEELLGDVARRLHYPVVIKPRFSRYLHEGKWVDGEVVYARDPEELKASYQASHANVPFPLVQEKIRGEGRGVFLLLWNGQVKAAFCHRRLREKPPWGGPSVYRESIPLDESLVRKSTALLRAIGWQGPAMVEFKVDRRTGEPNLMEVNGRFWGSLQLANDAGMNFPLLLYRLATGEDVPAQFDYKAGVKSRWLLGDLDQLLIRLTHRPGRNGLENDGVSRLRACLDFVKLHEHDRRYEVFRWRDRGPGWHEFKSYIRQLGKAVGGRKESSRAH